MKRELIDRNWRFKFKDSEFTDVDLPHDYSIIQKRDPNSTAGYLGGFFPGGVAVYEKSLFIPAGSKGKKIVLEFEGVYMKTTVSCNGSIAASHPYGYTSFHCDITPYLLYGKENIISVSVSNTTPSARWYSGSGIYRHVWLLTGERTHIAPWGVSFITPEVSRERSAALVTTKIANICGETVSATVRTRLCDADGSCVSSRETTVKTEPGAETETVQELTVTDARLWSAGDPYLYTLVSEVIDGGEVIDIQETKVGFRSVSVDCKNGFMINGVSVKLKGGCVHHDNGVLGAASYDRSEERKVELLKARGYNAIRCAHNPPAPSFLDACDRIGMLVIDEAFDNWRTDTFGNGYSAWFEDRWQSDLTSMILRDRNHPSVVIWSTGNEVSERDGSSGGYKYAAALAEHVRKLDGTRPVTHAICGIWKTEDELNNLTEILGIGETGGDTWGALTEKFAEPLDIVGYNYLYERYETDGTKYPGRVICGTESHPRHIPEYWDRVEKLPYVIGDFVWTALDYFGESGVGNLRYDGVDNTYGRRYPWHIANCGDLDICGFRRPQSYYKDCVWGVSDAPYIAVYKPEHYGEKTIISDWGWEDVVPSWTWPGFEGKPIAIDVYSEDDEVELFLNGESLGRKKAGKANRYIASFETYYQPGELIAAGYNNGTETARTTLKTAGAPYELKLTPDRAVIRAGYGDLSYVTVGLYDADKNALTNAGDEIIFEVSGPGTLVAVGNGNPESEEMYTGNAQKLYYGRALAVVRSSGIPGKIKLSAAAGGLKSSVVIRAE